MHLYMKPIEVETGPDHKPEVITWRNRTFTVEDIMDGWIYRGKWWAEEEKRYYVVANTDKGPLEIFRRDGEWVLSRVLD